VLAALKASETEGAELRLALEAALEEGKRRDGLIKVNRQLESARLFDRAQLDMELKRLQVKSNWSDLESIICNCVVCYMINPAVDHDTVSY
jgi:hypothetical protein